MGENTGMVWDAFLRTQTSIEKKSNVFFPVAVPTYLGSVKYQRYLKIHSIVFKLHIAAVFFNGTHLPMQVAPSKKQRKSLKMLENSSKIVFTASVRPVKVR